MRCSLGKVLPQKNNLKAVIDRARTGWSLFLILGLLVLDELVFDVFFRSIARQIPVKRQVSPIVAIRIPPRVVLSSSGLAGHLLIMRFTSQSHVRDDANLG